MPNKILTPAPTDDRLKAMLHNSKVITEAMLQAGIDEVLIEGEDDTWDKYIDIREWTPHDIDLSSIVVEILDKQGKSQPTKIEQAVHTLASQIIDYAKNGESTTKFEIRLDGRGFVLIEAEASQEVTIEGGTSVFTADMGIEEKTPTNNHEAIGINLLRISRKLIDMGSISPVYLEYSGSGDSGGIEECDLEIDEKDATIKIWETSRVFFMQQSGSKIEEREVSIKGALFSITNDIIDQFHDGYEINEGGGGTITIDPACVQATISTYYNEYEMKPYCKDTIIVSEQALDELGSRLGQFDQIVCTETIKQAVEQHLEQQNEAQAPR